MSQTETYKRFPAVRCWIYHILEGKYSHRDKSLYTIFGQVKRVRIVATIVDKREFINSSGNQEEELFEDKDSTNSRVEFDLDDGTGLIRAILWRVNPEDYNDYSEGDIVDIIGLIRRWEKYTSISPEIIKKIQEPNFLLLRDAEIIHRIETGDIAEIPEIQEGDNNLDELTDEIDIDSLFSDEENNLTTKKEEIFELIEEYSQNGEGIAFNIIKEKLDISEEELKNYLRELEMEMKIYQSENEIYQIY
ncbi:MAG: OB-fold nucleic acid binding domain-containing protein [Promethearchaeati archaeon]